MANGWVGLGLGQVNQVAGRVRSGRVDSYFTHDFFFLNIYIKRKQHVFVIWKVMQQITWCKMYYFEFTIYIKNELK